MELKLEKVNCEVRSVKIKENEARLNLFRL